MPKKSPKNVLCNLNTADFSGQLKEFLLGIFNVRKNKYLAVVIHILMEDLQKEVVFRNWLNKYMVFVLSSHMIYFGLVLREIHPKYSTEAGVLSSTMQLNQDFLNTVKPVLRGHSKIDKTMVLI